MLPPGRALKAEWRCSHQHPVVPLTTTYCLAAAVSSGTADGASHSLLRCRDRCSSGCPSDVALQRDVTDPTAGGSVGGVAGGELSSPVLTTLPVPWQGLSAGESFLSDCSHQAVARDGSSVGAASAGSDIQEERALRCISNHRLLQITIIIKVGGSSFSPVCTCVMLETCLLSGGTG